MDLLNLPWKDLNIHMDEIERCGIITAAGEIVELPNRSTYPEQAYLIHHTDIEGFDIIGTWHSHPRGPLNLSIDDYNNFAELQDLQHIIVTPRFVALYAMQDDFVMNVGRFRYA